MSANTRKIEAALLQKGLKATVTWTPPVGENADSGITGYYSEEMATTRYRHVGSSQFVRLPNSIAYSVEEALAFIDTIAEFE